MKATTVALAAGSLIGAVSASGHQNHMRFHAKRNEIPAALEQRGASNGTCGCTYGTTVIYGEMTLQPNPPPAPTPVVSSYTSPGTYTITKSTITLTETTTVASASEHTCSTAGECTYGGYTTEVPTPTTVTVPYCSVSGSSPATTSIVKTTTHYCSAAGACTPVAPETTSVSTSTVMVYPVPATYTPGTYTVPESTITVTATNTVYVCPFSSVKPTSKAPAPTTSKAPTISKVSSTSEVPTTSKSPATSAAPVATSKEITPAAYTPAKKPSEAPKPTSAGYISGKPQGSSNKPSGGKGGHAGIGANGNKWAMTYTPYTESGSCKSAGDVDSDIAAIAGKGFSTVRLYATDCSGLESVGGACKKHGLKLIVGVFIDNGGLVKAGEQVSEITAWGAKGNWDTVSMIVIGNEAIFNGYCSASELAGFITTCKTTFKAAGYGGPCTTTEPLGTLMASKGALCSAIDVVAANIQPYFNADVSSSDAGSFVASQLKLTGEQCPGKDAYNLECGWPSQGQSNGKAVAGTSQQMEAIGGILASDAASKTVIFSFQNDAWKSAGDLGVEPYFGCAEIIS